MLKRVSIQNFKSLKDVTLDLQKVNLLIGPNNSGKTNFLKALEMFDWLVEKNAIPGEVSRFSYRGGSHSDVIIHAIVDSNNSNNFNAINILHLALEFKNGRATAHKWSNKSFEYLFSDDTSVLDSNTLKGAFGYLKIYKPNPELIVKSSLLSSDEVLESDCGNIIPFIFNLSQNHKKIFRRLEDSLQTSVGDIVSIGTPSVSSKEGNRLRLKFFDQEENDFWADEVSEGVLYFLALLCIINQPNPPKLLLLEEPERGIHPRRIREVMDFIFRLAEEKDVQIIMTTHNEHVLDDFATRPESVFVFDKDEEGATYVRNLQKDIIEPTNQRNLELGLDEVDLTTNLSENWLYGLLGGVPTIL
ncbi:AAA family ATPase [Spirosoma utsteinense]|uniref:ATPase n=1 Tax=Spirosoma utsteinense TaxID=2585773 RepID=A0ABR6W303_9BACT|nr:AAA family ATPase [Spirosoma utsteinense]MBC3784369.1 putative ATPase [Spirosoma utsteinense]MBC3790832.1 putative ATPase [Spirosoma utsteinense]